MIAMRLHSLLGLACLTLVTLSRGEEELQQPTGEEMICSQEHAGDCYPKLFQPTKDFQVIREGQDLPPGLHVQMDMTTGKKQARLNIPEEGEAIPEIIELSKEQAIVVVPQPEEEKPEPSPPAGAPVYESAGKIRKYP
jgi:nucleotide exchange factor SIL1